MKNIFLRNGFFGKQAIIKLEFPFDFDLKELVKTFPKCFWDTRQKVWCVPYTDIQVTLLMQFFKDKVCLDYTGFKKINLPPAYPTLPELSKSIADEIEAFNDWMRNKRYSESTIRTYSEVLRLFYRFYHDKTIEEITHADIDYFIRNTSLSAIIRSLFRTSLSTALNCSIR